MPRPIYSTAACCGGGFYNVPRSEAARPQATRWHVNSQQVELGYTRPRRRTDHSIVFARWRQCALPSNRGRKCTENDNKRRNKFIFFSTAINILVISNRNSSECCLIKLLSYIRFEKYAYILTLKMASPGNQHLANCIGTLSFPRTEPTYGSLGPTALHSIRHLNWSSRFL